jgi:hypothetical protein
MASDQGVPRIDSQAVDPNTGRLTRIWYRFLVDLSPGVPPASSAVAAPSSPATYSAKAPGFMLIAGGTVTGISLTRGGVGISIPNATTFVPLSIGDDLSIVFSAAPTLTFIPG